MAGRFLLDTNIIIAHFAKEPAVKQSLAAAPEVFLPSVALGELYYGACKSARVMTNTRRIDEFAAKNTVLTCDTETAREYGRIKNDLRAKGKPIPENDIWIAAIARQYDLTLVTRDSHFNEIVRIGSGSMVTVVIATTCSMPESWRDAGREGRRCGRRF